MGNYDVTLADVQNAKVFLRAFLSANIPDGDFTEGGVVDDLIVGAHGFVIAWLIKQIGIIRDRQSLLTINNLPPEESVDDAADAILDNFFESRNQGAFARGPVTVHMTQKVDSLIPRTTRFFRTAQLAYYVDSSTDVFVPASTLTPNTDSTGALIDYTFQLNLVAARVGTAYNQASGRFVTADRFSPFLSFVENVTAFAFGLDVQSTTDFISSSQNAISLRALINARSNDALLRAVFPGLEEVLSVGYGDPEMTRDLVSEAASGVNLHVGGHTDIYTRVQTQDVTTQVAINTLTPRADGLVVILRDTAPPSGSFITAGVVPGDLLVMAAGIPEAPSQYIVDQVFQDEIWVSQNVPFSVATDEDQSPPALTYTVGDNYPLFNDKVSVVASSTATTSLRYAVQNAAILPGGPLYRVSSVQIVNAGPTFDPYRDPLTGNLVFRNRTNFPTGSVPAPGSQLAFQVVCLNPGSSQSDKANQYIQVGWPGVDFTGLTLEVTYTTLSGYASLAAYVEDANNRPLAANTLVRGQHPVYLAFTIPYRQSVNPSTTVFDPNASAQALVDFVNNFQSQDVLDQSALATQARAQSSLLAAIYPFVLDYDLLLPNGQVAHFQTSDTVTVFPDGVTTSAQLLNPTDFGLPSMNYFAAWERMLLLFGVSDRTIRYITTLDEVSFLRKA
jgi:hypothetical protein